MASLPEVRFSSLVAAAQSIKAASTSGYELADRLRAIGPVRILVRYQTMALATIEDCARLLDFLAYRLPRVTTSGTDEALQDARQIYVHTTEIFNRVDDLLVQRVTNHEHAESEGTNVPQDVTEYEAESLLSGLHHHQRLIMAVYEGLLPAASIGSLPYTPEAGRRTDQRRLNAKVKSMQSSLSFKERKVDAEPQSASTHGPSKELSSPLFVHYTISQDHTGGDHSIISERLAALGARSERQFCKDGLGSEEAQSSGANGINGVKTTDEHCPQKSSGEDVTSPISSSEYFKYGIRQAGEPTDEQNDAFEVPKEYVDDATRSSQKNTSCRWHVGLESKSSCTSARRK